MCQILTISLWFVSCILPSSMRNSVLCYLWFEMINGCLLFVSLWKCWPSLTVPLQASQHLPKPPMGGSFDIRVVRHRCLIAICRSPMWHCLSSAGNHIQGPSLIVSPDAVNELLRSYCISTYQVVFDSKSASAAFLQYSTCIFSYSSSPTNVEIFKACNFFKNVSWHFWSISRRTLQRSVWAVWFLAVYLWILHFRCLSSPSQCFLPFLALSWWTGLSVFLVCVPFIFTDL